MLNTAEMLCLNDPDLFTATRAGQIAEAKRACLRCTQQPACLAQCLDYERLSGETMKGTIGGTSEIERLQLHGLE